MNLFHVNINLLGPVWVFTLQWSKRKRRNAYLGGEMSEVGSVQEENVLH